MAKMYGKCVGFPPKRVHEVWVGGHIIMSPCNTPKRCFFFFDFLVSRAKLQQLQQFAKSRDFFFLTGLGATKSMANF